MGRDEDLVKQSWKYQTWRNRILQSGNKILKENIQCVIRRDENSFYSALVDIELVTPEEHKLNRCFLLRGPSVVIVPIIDTPEGCFTVVVRQRRIVNGRHSVEFPSGAVENNQPVLTAITEIQEELGLIIEEHELKSLCHEPLIVCDSIFDEVTYWYYFRQVKTNEFLAQLNHKRTGQNGKQEYIELQVVPFNKLVPASNFQILVGLQLLTLAKIKT